MAVAQKPIKLGLVVCRFNELITRRLAEGAQALLKRRGIKLEQIVEVEVPGAYEAPLAAQWLAETHKVDGVVVLGAVIRGSTDHYQYVCSAAASGLMNVQLARSLPVGFGILTCDTMEQALDRAGGKAGNKGAETAETVLEMIEMKRGLNRAGGHE
ncbi:MAG: 6,7-dimethyl-8-ribityllumazine synthase [Betaproteobacteria bacterium]|nr:6,7-dimethyl-8-ribityllumazine synthase [Betaproteobacteria bacterium]